MSESGDRHQSQVYLVTYSRADLEKVPSRESFGLIIVNAFQVVAGVEVLHWVVSQENHSGASGDQSNSHYHIALKLKKRARWSRVRQYIQNNHDIRVNFSSNHNTYYSAYQYVTKEDSHPFMSESHPDLSDPPRTERAVSIVKARGKARKGKGKHASKQRYSTYDVVHVIQEAKIKTRLELIGLAVEQKKEGKTKLAEFIANRGSKVVEEALQLAKEFDEAPAKLLRKAKSRIEILRQAYDSTCVEECKGQWIHSALTLLAKNEIPLDSFCAAIYDALENGRGKYRNIYIYGPANTGKTFMISPLKKLYNAFNNPATGTFAWVGAENAEIVLLNDFRWHPSIIAWGDLLQLLEGDIVHLPAPKNFLIKDIEFTRDTPFFATADSPMVLVKGGSIDHINSQMMQVRWRIFHFWRQIPQEQQIAMIPCPHCFAKFIIDYKD